MVRRVFPPDTELLTEIIDVPVEYRLPKDSWAVPPVTFLPPNTDSVIVPTVSELNDCVMPPVPAVNRSRLNAELAVCVMRLLGKIKPLSPANSRVPPER